MVPTKIKIQYRFYKGNNSNLISILHIFYGLHYGAVEARLET